MKRPIYLFLIAAASAMGGVMASGYQPDVTVISAEEADNLTSGMGDSLTTDSIDLDSLRYAMRIEQFVTPAQDTYKRLRSMRFDGFSEEEYYPLLMACFNSNVTLIDSMPEHPAAESAKAVLLDTYKDLIDGAYFYSAAGNQSKMTQFARAYLDVADMDCMVGEPIKYEEKALPTLSYIAASGAYNAHEFQDAIRYFDKYLATGDQNYRENVYSYLGQTCLQNGDYDHAVKSMAEGVVLYPANYTLLTLGLQACIDGKHGENIPFFLEKAMVLRPNDEQLLNIQGLYFEDEQQYSSALDVFQRLDELHPNNLSIAKHLALCYYNLGVKHYNDAILSEDEKIAKRHKRQSNAYFTEASTQLEKVLANDPLSIKYLKALAVTYGCRDEKEKFDEINTRIRALGHQPERSMMPSMIAFKEDNTSNFSSGDSGAMPFDQIPLYSDYAGTYVTDGLAKWAQRGQFEKMDEYTRRVSEQNVQNEYVRLCKEAERDYLDKYSSKVKIKDMVLGHYDPDHEAYMIHSDYGDMTVHVPLKNKEAEQFSSQWNKVKIRTPRYYIHNDRPAIASISFVTPNEKSYSYSADDAATYTYTDVMIDFNNTIRRQGNQASASTSGDKSSQAAPTIITRQSDVDKNIPVVKNVNDDTYVLIMANEDYQNVADVNSAGHDGDMFREYCIKTLGIPENHIKYFKNATLVNIHEGLSFIRNGVKGLNGNANVILYYSGHGMPDEETKDAYLIPVDGNATIMETCYSLDRLYEELNNLNAASTMVFLDACFSGARRDDQMLVAARGIARKPKAAALKGNMFVLSAASGQETAMAYQDKNHGMFTYFLLKKLQESKGKATLKEIGDYVTRNVTEQSNIINKKSQTPQVRLSGNMGNQWTTKTLR